MADETSKSKKYVMPGEPVGTEEEFVSGAGTHVENGTIYSSISGVLHDDSRTLSVSRDARLSKMAVGAKAIGRIDNISEPVALVVMEGEEDEIARYPKSDAYLILHASRIKRGYVKNVRDEYRIGDIIKAKIAEEKSGELHISTEDDDCGCLKAFCSSCRHPLVRKPTGLECGNCGRRENRKLASGYGNVSRN